MLDGINDSVNFGKALFLAVLIWGSFLVAAWYNFFSDARRDSWSGGGLSDFIDLFPEWLVNGLLAAWFMVGTFPLLNYIADKKQFGSAVGRANEMGFFDERPWYGVGGYQFLAVLLIFFAAYLIHRFRDR
ncbi:hypothetical protein [Pantoea stewartii]|uniref:hypothetical protein n=1 Tax=Pantoea stewartii TaxID=66269 RepID=UPI00345BB4CE